MTISPPEIAMPISPRVLRLRAAAEYIGLSERALKRLCAAGRGPRKIKLTARAVGWDVHDLDSWVEQQSRDGDGT